MKTRTQIVDKNVALTTFLAMALFPFGCSPVAENHTLLAVNPVGH